MPIASTLHTFCFTSEYVITAIIYLNIRERERGILFFPQLQSKLSFCSIQKKLFNFHLPINNRNSLFTKSWQLSTTAGSTHITSRETNNCITTSSLLF